MKKLNIAASGLLVVLCAAGVFAQKKPVAKPTPTPHSVSSSPRQIVFAVLNDGKTLEPIGYVSRGKFSEPVNGSGEQKDIAAFSRTYYKKGQSYSLVFGGAKAGTISVASSNAATECAKNTAEVRTTATGVHLGRLIMGLGTNLTVKTAASTRRKPTATEKADADALVKAEYAKEKLTPKTLHYQNLTAINVGSGGDTLVGSYWIEIDKLTRGLLFFIADKDKTGKYSVSYREYRKVDQADVMSGNISAVDEGVYHELLLDYLDVTGDGQAEIFTYQQGFEGAGFTAFERKAGRWQKAYEFNNYHCGF